MGTVAAPVAEGVSGRDDRGQEALSTGLVPVAASKAKVIILTGPTAVGKTATSLALAEALNGEIISADSVQVYRGLDVGSAKITKSERRGVPHHLIDVLDALTEFSAGDFYVLAREAVKDILQRGRTPIVVGGTGLYLRWFVHGKPTTPRSTPELAAAAQAHLDEVWAEAQAAAGPAWDAAAKWEAGVAAVAAAGDPASAVKLREVPNNYYRLLRVLEIVLSTGRPLAGMDLDIDAALDYDVRSFFLHRPRPELYRRIDLRVEQMMVQGLLPEAQLLLDSGLAPDTTCASKAIGYRQAMAFLQRCASDPSAATPENLLQVVSDIQAASRQLCHRQLTWFRDDALYRWVDAARPPQAIAMETLAHISHPVHEGGCGDSGRLSKAELNVMKRYRPELHLLDDDAEVEKVLDWVRANVAGRQAVLLADHVSC